MALHERAEQYATQLGLLLEHTLGYGKDGTVFSTNAATALKVFETAERFRRERDCYLRLAEHQVEEVIGHNVPRMISWSDDLLVIEMTIVRPPYLLDFASARLDEPPDFSPEVMEQWEQDRSEEFGKHWSRVQVIMAVMRDSYGIYLLDIHVRNIAFEDSTAGSE
jgi:hypothetical protein